MTIKKWKDIKGDFTHALLLGNGASIQLWDDFSYGSLWLKAKSEGFITEEIDNIARSLDTGTNFELLLRKLINATIINRQFKNNDEIECAKKRLNTMLDKCYISKEICKSAKVLGTGKNFNLLLRELENSTIINRKFKNNDEIFKAYKKVRKSLIKTVEKIHCEYADVQDRFNEQIPFLKNFNTIFSLNYDLLLYWIRIASDNKNEEYQFYDCFTKTRGFSDSYLSKYWEPANDHNQFTCVFYPHGALFLKRGKKGSDEKIYTNGVGADLLTQISKKISLPLFVSEGDSGTKLASIKRSEYLLKVYSEILPKSGPTLVIYGWSMDKRFDEHILNQIIGGNYEKIAVHIHRPTTEDIDQFIIDTNEKLKKDNFNEITYFELD